MNPLLTLSGKRLAEMIRRREATSREIVEAHIARLRKVNPVLNAVVKDRYDEALAEAAAADARTATVPPGELPPYHGVPCLIKEAFALAGMPNTGGLKSRVGILSAKDATAVARLRAAGAIPLGVTNVSELCMWMESNNTVYGRTRNPYDPGRTAGGSSGGEGAVIGAGGAPFGLGSDIGGSIRGPAFFNGIFGHKPTGGLIPGSGQFPISEGSALRYLTTGPLCRRAEDLAPLVRILAGPDGIDEGCVDHGFGDVDGVGIEGLTVLDVEDNGALPVSRDLREAQRRCAGYLLGKGARVKRARVKGLRRSFHIWSAMLSAASDTPFKTLMGGGKPINPFAELGKWLLRRSDHTFPAIGLALLEYYPQLFPSGAARFIEAGKALRRELIDLIGPGGVMLYPPYVSAAPRHNKPLVPPFNWTYTAIFNVMEFPVTEVPLGLNDDGLPLGVQVVGIPGRDHVTIAVAVELEKGFGGWTPPSRI